MAVVCLVVAAASAVSCSDAAAEIGTLTARARGTLTTVDGHAVTVSWPLPDGATATARIDLAAPPPPVGTTTEIAYQPADPWHAVIPGASLLADADRALNGLVFAALVGLAVLVAAGWRVCGRARLFRRPARRALVRRVRVQQGLLTRSWLETETGPPRWIPVYFDPVLVSLPSPAEVTLYGDPRADRLVAAAVDGVRLHPSGPVRAHEPRGRRGDNPTRPDEHARARARAVSGLARQFRVDSATLVPAPLVGLFWTFLTDGGFPAWAAATAITAALGLWLSAWRGSDPS
ncbi:hypothetical protein [Goodfellowiella coeruleoviolacea]|uniref:hypothetical protein n=1 Tax=Goodfellowiella coeruleoviolacea TaxID=334858 RepID=UPI0020A263DD|nr:hypothetical protein [Goodfellowiella coeruleoviolacea]